ncbi:hypothetical protein ACFX16_042468 [Malus domestica]
MADKLEGFDTRAENEYWDRIKRGLVHKESLVRKQSLHMLKTTLGINESGQTQSFSGGFSRQTERQAVLDKKKLKASRVEPLTD